MTVGSPPSRTVTTEFVVPRSIPTARAMEMASLPCAGVVLVRVVSRGTLAPASLAPGSLNFPAQVNGSLPDRVPGARPHPRTAGSPPAGDHRPGAHAGTTTTGL